MLVRTTPRPVDTKNDIDIRILDGGVLVNGVGYTMYNNDGGTLTNNGVLENRGTLTNHQWAATLTSIFGGSLTNAAGRRTGPTTER